MDQEQRIAALARPYHDQALRLFGHRVALTEQRGQRLDTRTLEQLRQRHLLPRTLQQVDQTNRQQRMPA
ncbi:hypothetical protein D3C81_1595170 [compost metagenome]